MTPKEKAIELVSKMYNYFEDDDAIAYSTAKQCALIAVDEIIKITAPYVNRYEPYYLELPSEMTQEYWEEVKQEIEKL